MSSTPNKEPSKCANCAKSATLTCKSCKDTPNAKDGKRSDTWYCGIECQKEHWPLHKTGCKAARARLALYRAGFAIQHICYIFLTHSFMWSPGRIEKTGTSWIIYPRTYTGKSRLIPFPQDLFPTGGDQEALLTYASCDAILSCLDEIIKTISRGKV